MLYHPTYDYQHSRCRSLEALRLQQLGKPPQCFSGSWLSHQWMNITSPQRDLEVSVSNETHFSSQRDKALKCECHLQSKGGTRNRAICRYSFVRYKRYSLTATINQQLSRKKIFLKHCCIFLIIADHKKLFLTWSEIIRNKPGIIKKNIFLKNSCILLDIPDHTKKHKNYWLKNIIV